MAILPANITALVLGPAGRQRSMVLQTLLTLCTYLFFAALQVGEVTLGLMDSVESSILSTLYLSGTVIFYLLVRTGGARYVCDDPSLTLEQAYFAVLCCAISYSISGPTRGGAIILLVLIITFAMFSATPAQSRRLAMSAFLLLSCVMAWKARTAPVRYPPREELIMFVWSAIVIGAMTILAGRMGTLRMRLSVQKAELQGALEQIQNIAIRDEMTGLFNRRHMRTLLEQAHASQLRDGSTFTLALFDIDRFKSLNDTYGHQAGDDALKQFADCLQKSIRKTDVVARWGGEEFLLFLPHTSAAAAFNVVERTRSALLSVTFDEISPGLKVTFSAGIAESLSNNPIETIVDRADKAMYVAKTSGRDRSVVDRELATFD